MKFYSKCQRIGIIEDMECTLLLGVSAKLDGRGYMKTIEWANGWIFETDDYFQSFCMVAHGFSVPIITDEEYECLRRDKVVHFSKSRTLELRNAIEASLPKLR